MSEPGQSESELVLHSSRWLWVLLFPFVAGVFAFGLWAVQGQNDIHRILYGWFAVIVGGPSVLILFMLILWNRSFLRLTPDGFTIGTWYGDDFIRWTDVVRFMTFTQRVSHIPGRTIVVYDLAEDCGRRSKLRRFLLRGPQIDGTDFLGDHDGYLPDTYGMSAKALTDLLNLWRQRHA